MASILLTGATGFVGTELGIQLARAGHKLRILTRNPKRAAGKLAFPAEAFGWDEETFDIPDEALEGVDAVLHLAGESVFDKVWTPSQKQRLRSSRVASTEAIVRAISRMQRKPSVLIQASAVGYYGDSGNRILDESEPPARNFLARICVDWERAGAEVRQLGVRHVVVRIGMVLGHEGGALPKLNEVYSAGLGARLGDGKQYVPWIHVEDLARIFVHALENESVDGAVNGVAPHPVTFAELHQLIGKSLRVPRFLFVPAILVRMILGGRGALVLSSQKVSSARVERTGFEFKYKYLEAALRDLFGDARLPGVHFYKVRQWVAQPRSTVWHFFCNENNLEQITPPWLNFKVVGKSSAALEKGALINYRLQFRGVPIKWQTEITHWKPEEKFVDEQKKGPYRLWYHQHLFEELAEGTLMTDLVQYKLPVGLLGNLAGGWLVARDVAQIFRFRLDKAPELIK